MKRKAKAMVATMSGGDTVDPVSALGDTFATQVFRLWPATQRSRLRAVSPGWRDIMSRMEHPEDELVVSKRSIRLQRAGPHCTDCKSSGQAASCVDIPLELDALARYKLAKSTLSKMAAASLLKCVTSVVFQWTSLSHGMYAVKLLNFLGPLTPHVRVVTFRTNSVTTRRMLRALMEAWPQVTRLDLYGSTVSLAGLRVIFESAYALVRFDANFDSINGADTEDEQEGGGVLTVVSSRLEHVEVDFLGSEFGGELVMALLPATVATGMTGTALRKIAMDEFDFAPWQVAAVLSGCPNLRSVGWELCITCHQDKVDILAAIREAATATMDVFYVVFRDEAIDFLNEVDMESMRTLPAELTAALAQKWGVRLKSLFLIFLAEVCEVGDSVLMRISGGMPSLEHLRVSNMERRLSVTRRAVRSLARLQNLKSLTIWNLPMNINHEPFQVLVRSLEWLEFLSVRMAPRVGIPLVETMAARAVELLPAAPAPAPKSKKKNQDTDPLGRTLELDFDDTLPFTLDQAKACVTTRNLTLSTLLDGRWHM